MNTENVTYRLESARDSIDETDYQAALARASFEYLNDPYELVTRRAVVSALRVA